MHHVDGLAQDCSDSSALAMGLLQFYAKPSMSIDAKRSWWVCKMVRRVRRKTPFLSGIMEINMKKTLLDLRLVHLCMDLQKWLDGKVDIIVNCTSCFHALFEQKYVQNLGPRY